MFLLTGPFEINAIVFLTLATADVDLSVQRLGDSSNLARHRPARTSLVWMLIPSACATCWQIAV